MTFAASPSKLEAPPAPLAQTGLHVAIVMDGNGRWAKRRGLPRTLGHKAGVDALRRTVQAAPDLGVGCLTIFGFSTENWSRPEAEVSELMALPQRYFETDLDRLDREGVQVRVVGSRERLSPDLCRIIDEAQRRTAGNDRFILQVAFNYGGRADIVQAAKRFAEDVAAGRARPEALTEELFEGYISSAEVRAPDLIIRPSGEQRLSNFFLWQASYAEFVFQNVLGPDFGGEHLKAASEEYRTRDRRFGGLGGDGG
ncbi:MAG: di-trans,poly-cis-decaprenylcistransferase, partial [Caulobacteraceae bacterium]|nr:di-trans,poly-cis-decaprenylcistransferase [Caulobacteraceae bacterium]